MTILNENSFDYRLENAKKFVKEIQAANKLIKLRKYKSAITLLRASKSLCIAAKSDYGNSLYFKILADLCLGIKKKDRCEQACDIAYHSLIEARKKLVEGGEDDAIEGYFWLYVEPSRIELWQDIIKYYLCLEIPKKALCSFNQLEIEIQEFIKLSPSITARDAFKKTFNPFKVVFTAWGYNQLGYYQKGLELLQSGNFHVTIFGEDIKTTIDLLEIFNEYQESDSPSKHLIQCLLQDLKDNQEEIFSNIKEQEQMFVESLEKNDFQIFINGLEKHKFYFKSIFQNLTKVVEEENLISINFNKFDINKIYIPPLAIIHFWQTGVSLLNLRQEKKGRQLINSIKSVLSESEDKFFFEASFDEMLISLITQS